MFDVYPIDALHVNDNYIWAITPGAGPRTYVVDPGDAAPVLAWLERHNLELGGILLTHRHWDHVNGVPDLLEHAPVPVWGPADSGLDAVTAGLRDGDELELDGVAFGVIAVPGHTREHIAYYSTANAEPALFCGDTLFASGCGRVFDGRADQLHQSLTRLARLPGATRIYCGHEYTLANLAFAAAVEPDNGDIHERRLRIRGVRDQGRPSLPTQLHEERLTNPFLRSDVPEVAQSAERHEGRHLSSETEVFAALRRWKDGFR